MLEAIEMFHEAAGDAEEAARAWRLALAFHEESGGPEAGELWAGLTGLP